MAQTVDLDELARAAESGARAPHGFQARLLFAVALCWSLFQLWYASPLPFMLGVVQLNFAEARAVHLAFALFLAFATFPASRQAPRDRVPWGDWLLASVAASAAAYLLVFQAALSERPGAAIPMDVAVAAVGLVLLLAAARRALGLPLVIVAGVFLVYALLGPWMPDVISHRGASPAKLVSHQWLTSEGVFGIALGVSTSFVFLFVLFGALLERAGAGSWFIRVSYAALGHLRGGPAKAAVVSSGLTGMISGSSIANVVTTGTFTIPLMKRVGFSAPKAGAIEVAASVNGQIMPPVMGAAAFLMVEYVGIPYIEVIRHAFLPAAISYAALLYIVHLEACKARMEGLPRPPGASSRDRLIAYGLLISGLIALAGALSHGLGWVREMLGPGLLWLGLGLMAVAYLACLRLAALHPQPEEDDFGTSLPPLGATVKGGLHYLIPVVVLIWCLMIERLSPALSAFWATVTLIIILLTQRPLLALLAPGSGTEARLVTLFRDGMVDLAQAMVKGARNMVGIAIATAAAGIVVGTVTMTGLGLVMTDFVEFVSGGNLIIMLLFTALICLVLGMGLPTTANYIVVATLMAPVVVSLAAQGGLLVPLIAVHLFVFYFGLMADVTPPVGLATFAASAVSGGDPIRTGVQAFFYSARTIVLPFIFIFNTQLLLIGVDGLFHLVLIIASALIAMLVFAAATMGWFLTRSRLWESAALLLVAFTLFRPDFFWQHVFPPFETRPGAEVVAIAEALPENGFLRIEARGFDITGAAQSRAVVLRMGAGDTTAERLARAGLVLGPERNGGTPIQSVGFNSAADRVGLRPGWIIETVAVDADRPAKEWMMVPALVLLGGIAGLQRRRARRAAPAA